MAKNKTSESSQQIETAGNNDNKMFYLAMCIVIFGLLAVTLLGVSGVYAALKGPEGERVASVKDILSILLPVISAWIGTIIAYYFSKENFKSATDSTTKLFKQFSTTEEKLRSITAKEVMIDIDQAVKLILDKEESKIMLKTDIIDGKLDKDKNDKKNRLPILDDQMHPKYIVHRSTIDKFIVQEVAAGKKLIDLTLQDMLNDDSFKNTLIKGFSTVRGTSNLTKVKSHIDDIKECLDVFVTEDGERDSKVLGWITNVIVTKKCVA